LTSAAVIEKPLAPPTAENHIKAISSSQKPSSYKHQPRSYDDDRAAVVLDQQLADDWTNIIPTIADNNDKANSGKLIS